MKIFTKKMFLDHFSEILIHLHTKATEYISRMILNFERYSSIVKTGFEMHLFWAHDSIYSKINISFVIKNCLWWSWYKLTVVRGEFFTFEDWLPDQNISCRNLTLIMVYKHKMLNPVVSTNNLFAVKIYLYLIYQSVSIFFCLN